uniref:Venom s1 protease 40 n=1 Tax=Pristhesancus plagipennis TaxID=1955184 RepID=A0A1Q1NPI1_PRIPG|nr:venom s1 protease 40 [Pristhesancus plagipennis]
MLSPTLSLCAILLFGTLIHAQRVIRMKVGETLEMKNDKYPEVSTNIKETWMLGTSTGGAIKLQCDDIRINGKNCDDGKLMVSAGDSPKVFCNTVNNNNYEVTSLFESLYVELEVNSGEAAFKCKATALSSPAPADKHQEEFHVKLGQIEEVVSISELPRVKDYEYIVTGEPDTNLLATCFLAHTDSRATNKCDGATLILSSGGEEKKYCESEHIVFHSVGDILKINLKTGLLVGSGYLFCNVRAIDGGNYSKYKEIASEEVDSSEHGLVTKRGKKSTSCNCGWANKDVRRVIYGYDTGKHEYPWSVSLQYAGIGFHFCGGSIISEYHVLTAAHCVVSKKPEEIMVVMGTHNRSDSSISIKVKEIIRHDYDKETAHNDIAILALEKKIQTNQFIGPICLPSKDPKIDHQYVTAMGWGNLAKGEYDSKDPRIQKETKLRVVDIYSCTIDWNFKWAIKTAKVMCTWSNHTDICLGDSGGPVVWLDPETNRYTLVGMPALCDGCKLTKPSIHTSVFHFYDWIQSKIAGSVQPDGKTCTKID